MKYQISKEVSSNLNVVLEEPRLYQVVVHNDDFTPMEFVVSVLERFFYMSRDKASEVMLQAHIKGSAVCGVFAKDAAETISSLVVDYARLHEHPLNCSMDVAL